MATHIAPVLEKKIIELNRKIDQKILTGRSYQKEARQHRMLLLRLKNSASRNFFSPSFSFLSFL
jgi:hypothetical protein